MTELEIAWAGDVARLLVDGRVVADRFWDGSPWLLETSDAGIQPGSDVVLQILPLPKAAKELPSAWLEPDTKATIVGAPQLKLGPEPLLPAQRVVLHLGDRDLAVGTDGLSPFQIIDSATGAPAP